MRASCRDGGLPVLWVRRGPSVPYSDFPYEKLAGPYNPIGGLSKLFRVLRPHRRTAASFPFSRHAIYNGVVYTIPLETYVFATAANVRRDRRVSAEVEIVVPVLQQDVGSVPEADDPGL